MVKKSGVPTYSEISRFFHWATLAVLGGVFVLPWVLDSFSRQQASTLLQIHRSFGIALWFMTLIRLAWIQFVHPPLVKTPAPPLEHFAARAMVVLLYGLLVAIPLIGYAYSSLRSQDVVFFNLIPLPDLLDPNKALAHQARAWHSVLSYILLGAIGLHGAAGLYHHFIRKDAVLSRMLPGIGRRAGRGQVFVPSGASEAEAR